jgi:hypothetical protein
MEGRCVACTAEVRGSNPLSSTRKSARMALGSRLALWERRAAKNSTRDDTRPGPIVGPPSGAY